MYPTIAGLMVKNTPYKDTADIKTKLFPKLTPAMQEIFLKYDKNLIALKPAPEFVEDIWNNGLYRWKVETSQKPLFAQLEREAL